ncbi:MAG: methionine--tRNA ligase [Firmicutes bacterium]|nr:methionine--tRNA ligase [Bacillota bacterium]
MSKKNVYIGPAWTYANNYLHIGHLCSYLSGDVLARFHRKQGDNVILGSGSDCHGTPITNKARDENKSPREVAEFFHQSFIKSFKDIDYSFDLYTKTMADYHIKEVQQVLITMHKNGYIYERTKPQAFCEKCDKFINDREVVLTCPKCARKSKGDSCDCGYVPTNQDLIGGTCQKCGSSAVSRDNTNLVLASSKMIKELESFLKKQSPNWRPNAVGESYKYLDYLKQEKANADKEITRDIDWGVPLPDYFKGYENKRVYVWIEAVLGYYTVCKQYCEQSGQDINHYFNNPKSLTYYCHGKDNVPFHTIWWPSILIGMGRSSLPSHIVSVEYMNIADQKISKSVGNLITVDDAIKQYGSDSVRYFFIARGPERKDSNFSNDEMVAVHNGEIVNKIGNFINRTLKFKAITKTPIGKMDATVKAEIEKTYKETATLIEKCEFKAALKCILDLVEFANKYYEEKAPWKLENYDDVIYTCCNLCLNIANLIEPFMPKAAAKIQEYLCKAEGWKYNQIKNQIDIKNIEPLFTRL